MMLQQLLHLHKAGLSRDLKLRNASDFAIEANVRNAGCERSIFIGQRTAGLGRMMRLSISLDIRSQSLRKPYPVTLACH